jgi:hypothetical protein
MFDAKEKNGYLGSSLMACTVWKDRLKPGTWWTIVS